MLRSSRTRRNGRGGNAHIGGGAAKGAQLRGRLELRAVAMSQPSRAVDEGAAKSHAENLAILVERERVVLAARNLHDPAAAEGASTLAGVGALVDRDPRPS